MLESLFTLIRLLLLNHSNNLFQLNNFLFHFHGENEIIKDGKSARITIEEIYFLNSYVKIVNKIDLFSDIKNRLNR